MPGSAWRALTAANQTNVDEEYKSLCYKEERSLVCLAPPKGDASLNFYVAVEKRVSPRNNSFFSRHGQNMAKTHNCEAMPMYRDQKYLHLVSDEQRSLEEGRD
jgi:hypothetical protein